MTFLLAVLICLSQTMPVCAGEITEKEMLTETASGTVSGETAKEEVLSEDTIG